MIRTDQMSALKPATAAPSPGSAEAQLASCFLCVFRRDMRQGLAHRPSSIALAPRSSGDEKRASHHADKHPGPEDRQNPFRHTCPQSVGKSCASLTIHNECIRRYMQVAAALLGVSVCWLQPGGQAPEVGAGLTGAIGGRRSTSELPSSRWRPDRRPRPQWAVQTYGRRPPKQRLFSQRRPWS
jgi:hypothetical protein